MKIITDKNFLNRKSKQVSFNEGLDIGNTLLNILSNYPTGIGLAAPQIGLLKKVFVIKLKNFTKIFINPGILLKEKPIISKESCLSFPEQICNIVRYKKICIINQIDNFRDETLRLQNKIAIIWQHEFDHLNGITILDKNIGENNEE